MHLTILGNSSGGPYHGRHYTAQILQQDNHLYLIDCGEGTQMQLFDFRIRYDKLKQIFISHLHGDHVFGLMGLLTNWCLKKRTEPLELFSPPGLREMVEATCRYCYVRIPYEIVYHEVDPTVSIKVFENSGIEVWTIPLHHRIPTTGWLFREKQRPANIRKEQIEAHNIHFSLLPDIKSGADLHLPNGVVIPNSELTIPPAPPRSYAFCSDTAPSDLVVETIRQVNLLYHEATFTSDHQEEALLSFHSTASQAAETARKAGVEKLLIGHFSGRYTNTQQLLAEASAIFPQTALSEEGVTIRV
jgi:ribonuclease Z